MVTDFRGGSNLHRLLDLHLLGVVRLMNDTVRAAAARELLGDLVCGVPGRDRVGVEHPADVPGLGLHKDY
jgi:hypothetical protein